MKFKTGRTHGKVSSFKDCSGGRIQDGLIKGEIEIKRGETYLKAPANQSLVIDVLRVKPKAQHFYHQ